MVDTTSSDSSNPSPTAQSPSTGQVPEQTGTSADAGGEEEMNPGKKRAIRIGGTALAVLVLLGAGIYWFAHRDLVTTDDAFVDGRAIQIAPQIAGNVIKLNVTDNQFVHAGDVLFEIDARTYQAQRDQALASVQESKGRESANKLGQEIAQENFPARLQQARAVLATSQANLQKAQIDFQREIALAPESRTGQEIDTARAALAVAKSQVADGQAQVVEAQPVRQNIGQSQAQLSQSDAQVDEATAQLRIAELNLSYAQVRAPQDGWVTHRSVEVGNYVSPGEEVISIVSPQIWVTANFKEDQLARMRAQQPVDIRIDAYPDMKIHGHVDSMQLGSGSRFAAFPAENATGNYVKIVQRIPVKIAIDSGLDQNRPLPLGASAVPTVDLR